jgi:hypothetical protein
MKMIKLGFFTFIPLGLGGKRNAGSSGRFSMLGHVFFSAMMNGPNA